MSQQGTIKRYSLIIKKIEEDYYPNFKALSDYLGFFSYIFLFLHTLASIVQRFTTRFVSVIQSSEQKALTS